MSDSSNEKSQPGRKRGLTSLTLKWISEKLRRSEQIKGEIQEGKYKLDSQKIASSILNEE